MKLLYCRECHDIQLLIDKVRSCLCAKSSGLYKEDGNNAIVQGPCEVIGFHNRSFAKAITQMKQDTGTPFEAFVIPRTARTVSHV